MSDCVKLDHRLVKSVANIADDSGLSLCVEGEVCTHCGKVIHKIRLAGEAGVIFLPHSNTDKLKEAIKLLNGPLLRNAIKEGAFMHENHSVLRVNLRANPPNLLLVIKPKDLFKGFHHKSSDED